MKSKLVISPARALRLMGVLQNNISIDEVSDAVVEWVIQHPREAGALFTGFLKNLGRAPTKKPKFISIDRDKPFDPAKFIGSGWSIWRGPADGDGLSGDEDQDKRSLALTELDVTTIRLETMLKPGEKSLPGDMRQQRLKEAGHVRLDAGIFQHFWRNQHLIPKHFKSPTGSDTTLIYIEGTVLRSPKGNRCVLFFYWHQKSWKWDYIIATAVVKDNDPSAIV